jgi:hypothetical protein
MQEQTALQFFETVLRYFSATSKNLSDEDVRIVIKQTFPEMEGKIMPTLAERWIEQGLQQGRATQIAQMLEYRFGSLSLKAKKQIRELSLLQLEQLGKDLFEFKQVSDLRK